jgi:two-component sensor histidine kinase
LTIAVEDTERASSEPPQGVDTRPGPAPARTRSRPIQFWLGLLVVVIVVPVLAFAIVLLDRNNRAQRDTIETLAEATAGSVSEAVDREVRGMLTTLRVLAIGSELREDELAAFHARARLALADTGAHVIVLDGALNQLLNTRVDWGTQLGRTSDPESARFAEENRVATVSDGFVGRTAQRWVFNVVLPPSLSGIGGRYLIMTQDAVNLTAALAQQELRGGWNASLVDRNGIVLASSFMSSDTGKPFFLGPLHQSGVARGRPGAEAEETDYVAVVQRSDMTGWSVVLWAPSAVVDAPLRRSMLSLLFGGMAVLTLAAGAGWMLGRQITAPARRLAADAARLGAGDDVKAVDYPIAEFATVSAAIADAGAQRREAENEIRFLMREVAHRSKNQLTVVASIAKQTGRGAPNLPAFQDAFQKRLQGLAKSTDLLIAGGAAGVELGDLVRSQIEPFAPGDAARLEIGGPALRLNNHAAQTLGMAIHELATNAAKYGAFALPGGRLSIGWKLRRGQLELTWRETVSRLRKRADHAGFGTQVIERMVGGTLDAQIERTIHRDGLECRFTIPVEKLRPDARAGDEA